MLARLRRGARALRLAVALPRPGRARWTAGQARGRSDQGPRGNRKSASGGDRATARSEQRPDAPGPGSRLSLLAADLEQVRRPLGSAAICRRRAPVPAAGAGDRLGLVFVLVDHVLEGLNSGRGLDRWATVHGDSCTAGRGHATCERGSAIVLDLADSRWPRTRRGVYSRPRWYPSRLGSRLSCRSSELGRRPRSWADSVRTIASRTTRAPT